MTGFGRGESTADHWNIEVELSGVNRKQIDISVFLPGSLTELEGEIKRLVNEEVSRGRVTARIAATHTGSTESRLVLDETLAQQYVDATRRISEETGIETRLTAADLFRAPGLFRLEESEADPAGLRNPIVEALNIALKQLVEMQTQEGEHLRSDLIARIEIIVTEIDAIRDIAPRVPIAYRQTLTQRLQDSGLELDLNDERVMREVGIFAERCDITEELTRLDSHIAQFRTYLASDEPVGRPLDFLCQEFNRELNTIGSKANDADIAQRIVIAKTELEKIREQVQNVQ
ncbi:MAG: YicC/YloC family endoribonuclease [Verrucomicrobiota bacterium]